MLGCTATVGRASELLALAACPTAWVTVVTTVPAPVLVCRAVPLTLGV